MKIEKREGSDERRILLGMVTDRSVLARISQIWSGKDFSSQDANLIAGWCLHHFDQYGEPPNKAIESAFAAWAAKRKNKNRSESVEKLLRSLARDFDEAGEQINSQHILDIASSHFNKVRLRHLSEIIEGNLDAGDIDKALEEVSRFGSASIASDDTIDVLTDEASVHEAFSSKEEPLIKMPGQLGRFFGDTLERDAFIAILAPEKRGKTFCLLDIAWRAVLQRKRVVFFQCGDLSRSQMIRRVAARSLLRPLTAKKILWPSSMKRIKLKTKDRLNKAGVSIEFDERQWDEPATPGDILKRFKVIINSKLADGGDNFKLVCTPNNTLSAVGVRDRLRAWDREGWSPDVILIDYADIMAPSSHIREPREAINNTWMRLRAISQEFHCLLVTATQADAKSYNTFLLRKENFSDDKRKYAHVTGIFGINQIEAEKKLDITRLNWIMVREQESTEQQVVYCAGCRPCAAFAVKSA